MDYDITYSKQSRIYELRVGSIVASAIYRLNHDLTLYSGSSKTWRFWHEGMYAFCLEGEHGVIRKIKNNRWFSYDVTVPIDDRCYRLTTASWGNAIHVADQRGQPVVEVQPVRLWHTSGIASFEMDSPTHSDLVAALIAFHLSHWLASS